MDARVYNLKCHKALGQNNPKKAVKLCSKAIKKDPAFLWPYNNRAAANITLQNYLPAIQDTSAAIEKDAKYANAHINRGNAKMFLGDYKGALEDYDTAADLKPNQANILRNKGIIYGKTKNAPALIETGSQMLETGTEKGYAYHFIGQGYELLGENQKAYDNYLKSFESGHTSNDAARLLLYARSYNKACDLANIIWKSNDCGWIAFMKNKLDTYEETLRADITNQAALEQMQAILYKMKNYPEQIEYLDILIKQRQDYNDYNARAWSNNLMGKYEAALPDALKAIEIAPANANIAHIYDTAAVAYAGLENYGDAMYNHDKAVENAPLDPEVLLNRSKTKAALKDYKGAQADLDKVKKLSPKPKRRGRNADILTKSIEDLAEIFGGE